jgi:hypothetical protein
VAQSKSQGAIDAAIEIIQPGRAGVVSFNMLDADVDLLMRPPWTMTCSDGAFADLVVFDPATGSTAWCCQAKRIPREREIGTGATR